MQMDHLPSHEVEAPIPIRSAFVVGVGRGFGAGAGNGSDGGGGGGPSSYPSNNHHHHHHVVHHHLAGATVTAAAASSVVATPTIPKEERPCDSSSPPSSLPPSPPQLTLPVLVANGPPSPPPPPPPAVVDANHGSTHVIASCKAVAPPPPMPESSSSYVYRECLRNHAASLGGNATDGCGEFMPGDGASGDALLCSACGCHRNFHRKELAGIGGANRPYGTSLLGRDGAGSYYHPQQHVQYLTGRKVVGQKGVLISTAAPCTALVPYRQPPPQQHPPHHAPTAMAIPLHAAVPAPESDQEMDQLADGGGPGVLSGMYHTNVGAGHFMPVGGMPPGFGKKRFRTKFTTEQKKRMLAFAERVGWRLQRRDEAEVQGFCQEIGVKRRVLKVWMHNNKHNRRNLSYGGIFPTIITNNDGASIGDDHHDENSVVPHEARSHDHNGRDLNQGNHHHQQQQHNGVAGPVTSPPSHPQPLQHHHHHGVATVASPQSHPQPLQHHHPQHPAGTVIQVEE